MPENQEQQFDSWKDAWESNAQQTNDALANYSEDQLLEIISNNQSDLYYQIWDIISKKGSKTKAPTVLINYLEANQEACMDLNRSHCLDAIFKILKTKNKKIMDDFLNRIVQMSVEKTDSLLFQQGINDLRKYINNLRFP
jgi:hypothetical protein